MAGDGFTWWQALGLTLAGGAVGSALGPIITWARETLKHNRTRDEEAALLASRLAVIFENFAAETANRVGETDAWLQSHTSGAELYLALPELGPFPSDAEWKALPKVLAHRVFEFPNQRGLAQGVVSSIAAHDDDAAAEDFVREGGKCGVSALELAKDLRAAVGLPERDASKDAWNFEETLRTAAGKRADRGIPIELV